MSVDRKHIVRRAGAIFAILLLLMVGIAAKVIYIQIKDGEKYKNLSNQITEKVDIIHANKGNVYAADGSLLATSMFRYEIRMDVMTVDQKTFNKDLVALAQELSNLSKERSKSSNVIAHSAAHYKKKISDARIQKNRYLFIARNLSYPEYRKMRSFPIFKLGANKGGFIAIQKTVREHPLGKVAARTIGYADYRGRPGIEGAFANELKGKNGQRLKQKIAKGQWKPINDENEVEPQDGKDIITTIDVNMQDIAHQALLEQLEKFEADHGTVVLMEVSTGEIKAIANLGRTKEGKYYEKRNYAVYESHEPGSTFKLMSLIVALDDKVIDTTTKVDTKNGVWRIHNRSIKDSNNKGYGVISAARAFEFSSNTGVSKLIYNAYKDNPKRFVAGLRRMNLDQKLGLPIRGEGEPFIPHPDDKSWSGLSLAWMSHGYGVQLTPLQILTFYNAIANNGEMVKPKFVKEIRYQNNSKGSVIFEKEIINKRICSQSTVDKAKEMLKNVVERGTATNIHSNEYSIAGKTGTCQAQYWTDTMHYVASFTGFFPVKKPKYSCIVVIHKPTKTSYYGNIVAAPVFKKIAQKIYVRTTHVYKVKKGATFFDNLETKYNQFYKESQKAIQKMPNVKGMSGMDAISMLENLGLKVKFSGSGTVKEQSIIAGKNINKGITVYLSLT